MPRTHYRPFGSARSASSEQLFSPHRPISAAATNMTPLATAEFPRPADRPEADIVLYDGHCNICRAGMRRLVWWDCQQRLSYLSIHDPLVAQRWPDISHDRLMQEMCIIERAGSATPGRKHWGVYALRLLTRRLRRLWWLAPVLHLPGAMLLARPLYRFIAKHRYRIAGKSEACDGDACSLHR